MKGYRFGKVHQAEVGAALSTSGAPLGLPQLLPRVGAKPRLSGVVRITEVAAHNTSGDPEFADCEDVLSRSVRTCPAAEGML